MQNGDDGSYNHVPLKPAFTVQATYKLIGKLKPRQFPLDELDALAVTIERLMCST